MFAIIRCIIDCFLIFAGGLIQIGTLNVKVAISIESSVPTGTLLLLHAMSVSSTSNTLVQSNGLLFD